MNNTNNPTDDEEQLATIPTDYQALLAMTRPLVIAEDTLPSWRGGEICRSGFGASSGSEDWRAEFALRRGEILRSHESGSGIAEDEELAAAAGAVPTQRPSSSNMQIRICLGMS